MALPPPGFVLDESPPPGFVLDSEPKKPSRTTGEAFKDIGAGLVSGLGKAAQFPGQVYGLVSGEMPEETGLYGLAKRIEKAGEEAKSAGLKAQQEELNKKLAGASGILEEAGIAGKEILTNPALLANLIAETAPQMIGPAGLAKAGVKGAVMLGAKGTAKEVAKLGAEKAAQAAAQRVGTRAAIGTGAAQQGADIGAETYSDTYKALIEKGVPEDEAKRQAINLARSSGASAAVISLLAQRLPGARRLEEVFAGVPGVGGRALGAAKTGLGESIGEGFEEAGGKLAQNIAMQQVSPEQELLKGVGAAGAMGALPGGVIGAGVGALQTPGLKAPVEEKKEEKQDEVPQKEPTKEQAMLQLGYTPKVENVEKKDPLRNPVGNFNQDELGKDLVQYVNKFRQTEGRPKLSTFSLEDLVDAGAPQQEIDRLLSFKNRFDESIKLSADDVKNIAQQRNVDTDTIGFKHFLTRSAGTEDLDAMSQPQLHSAFLALSKLKPSEELRVLPEGTNATRFTEAQYANALKGINLALADSPSLGRTSVIKEIQDFTGLENSSDAEAVLKTALDNGDLESIRTPHFALVNENGRVAFVVDSRESAERSVAKAEKKGRKLTIKDGAAIDITLPGEVVELPGGPDVRRGEFKQGEAPEGYEVRVGGDVLATVDNEEEAHDKAERYGATRQKDAVALQKQIDALNKQIESQRAALDQMEARGQGNSLAFQQRSAQVNADNQAAKAQIAQLEQTKGQFLRPLTVKATKGVQSITKEGFTYFEDNKPVATFDTREKADAFALSRLDEDKLGAVAVLGPTLKGLRAKSLGQLAKRELESRGRKGIAVEYKVKEGETAEQAKERVKANLTARGILSAQEQKARAEESKASKEMIEKADKIIADLRPMLNRFGLEKVGISVVESIRNGTADGFYAKQLVRIALDSQDPVGTMRHEAIHALKEMGAFTPEQWKVLEARAKKEWIQKFIVDRGLYEEYQKVYKAENKTLDGFDEYIAEEAIADAFKFYKKPQPGLLGNIIYRMRQFFEALKNAFNKNGFKTSDQVFEAIEAGKAKPQQEAKGEGKLSLRQYKLDINREERVKQKRISLPYDEQQAVERDAAELQLTKKQVAALIKTIKDDKKRYPQSQGWAPLEVVGVGIKLDENEKPIPGTEFPKYKAIAYAYNVPAGSRKAPPKIDQAWLGKVTKEFQNLVENLYKRASNGDVNAKNIIAHQTWYKNVAKTLRAEYGGFGDVLADLLGATSPNTPVDTNWKFSVDIMRRFVRGEFNSELEKFSNYLDQGKSPSDYPAADKIRQASGKLYGMNSTNGMLALVDMWRIIKPGQAPKARNFALNLIGQSNIATIDVWAARMLRRAANVISKGEYARIPPPAETGVSGTWNASATDITGAFGFGAEVMRQTSENLKAKGINIDPPDLQAIAWFAEKELWGTKGWTTKTGEGGSFEENIEENPADRYLAGHSIQVGETAPSKEETVKVQQQILDVLRSDPSVVAVRTKTTKGLYGGTVEESFDSEWVVDKDKFDPAPIISKLAEVSKANTQFDIFVSKVVGPNEDNPNARPGIEIYFKTQQDLDAVLPILQAFTSRGQDGFTLAVDPRAAEDSNRYMGVRLQYVPEISMRWDEGLRRKLKAPGALERVLEGKARILERIANEVAQMEEVAYAAALKYDTVVIGQENYDAYISARASGENRPVGKGVWFGQPVRDHVEAAIGRYTRGQIDEGAVPDGGEAQARYSIRPPESAVRPGEGSRRGITLGKQQEGAGTVEGIHYGKAKVDVLNAGMFGSGIRGEEAKRLAQSQDPRIKKRVYFYIPNEVGFVMRPEAGLGQHVYTQTFNNILPQNEEMARLYRSVDKDLNAFESAVVDAGYDGYAVPSDGMMVILNHNVPVNYEGLAYELREQGKLVQNKIKYSLRASPEQTQTPQFKKWFGNSKVVDANGEPLIVYHGSPVRDFNIFDINKVNKNDPDGPYNGFWFSTSYSDAESSGRFPYGRPDEKDSQTRAFYISLKNPATRLEARRVAKEIERRWEEMSDEEYAAADKGKSLQEQTRLELQARGYDGVIHEPYVTPNREEFEKNGKVKLGKNSAELVKDSNGYVGLYENGEFITNWETYDEALDAVRHGVFVAFKPSQIKSATENVGGFDVNNPDIRYSLRTVFDPAITARMDATTAPRESKGFVQRVLDAVSPESRAKIRSGLIHGLEGFERSAKRRAAKMGNQELLADVSSIAAASQSLRAAAVTSESFRRGVPVYTKGYTTIDDSVKGLMDALAPLAKAKDPEIFRYFQFYAASKRGARLDSEGREHLFEQADLALAAQLAAQAKSIGIDFDSVYKDYQRYNEGIVKFSRDTGVLSAEQADYFMKFGDYIPFYRQMEGQETIGPKLFSSFSNVAVPKKLKGGEAKIGDFMENAVRNARSAIEAGMKNIAAQRGVRDALDEGLAKQVSGFQQRTPDIVSVREDGKTVYYQLADPLLVEAFKGLNIQKHPWVSIAAKPADWLRNLVTKDPGFMLANIMRDSVSSWVTSGSSMIPVVDSFKQMGKILAGNNPTAAAMAKAGLGGYEFTGDLKSSAKDLEKGLRKKSGTRTTTEKALLPVTAAWDLLEKGSNASDMATRAEVYERVLKETGNEAEAFYQACEVLNFSRKGNWPVIQVFTALVPFMNARIQGLDILYRSGFGQMATANKEKMQKAFIVRSLSILALSAAYWALVHDDDEYKKLTEEERDNYWIIPGTNVNGKPLRFPIPFELGFLFKVVPERIAETMWGEDTGKQFAESIQRNLIATLKVNPIPQAITPLVENAYNISLFTGEPIVGRGLEKVEPKYQATSSTSSLALMIGDQFDVSPLKVDNLIRGYTGTMGMYAASMLDGVFSGQGDPVRATKRFEQLPVVKRFVSTDSGTVAAFFDFKDEVDSTVRTFNFLEKNDPEELVKRLDAGDLSLYGLRSYINSIDKEMTKVREVRTAVNASKDMTPDEKRVMLDSLHEVELALTADVKAIRKQYH